MGKIVYIGGKQYFVINDMMFTKSEIVTAKSRYLEKKLALRVDNPR